MSAWDTSLTYKSCTALPVWLGELAGASAGGKYALFAGGDYVNQSGSSRGLYNYVTAYDSALTKSSAAVLDVAPKNLAGVGIGDYAIFAGGSAASTNTSYSNATSYDQSLTKKTQTALSVARWGLIAATAGDFAIFAGGSVKTAAQSTVDVYTVG